MDGRMSDDKSEGILHEAREAYQLAQEVEQQNREAYKDDVRFARLGEQWDESVRKQREDDQRPCLTINKLPAFIRQVVNDARQNKPSIKVHPADSKADVKIADIYSGLIRNIEYTSDADVAYDTALECAVTGGFGYFKINTRYATDDTFEQDIVIERIANPLAVFGDPFSTTADSSDWNVALVVDFVSKDAYEKEYKGEPINWNDDPYLGLADPWMTDEGVLIAEYWVREKVKRTILLLSNGEVIDREQYQANIDIFEANGVGPVGEPRETESYSVKQHILSGAEVLKTVDWPGKYIPIVPVYGEEVNYEGRRIWRSLIRDAKDSQRMYNYWRTMATELVALAPKAPFIGPRGAFETDGAKWETANLMSHAYIEYDGSTPPQRQQFAGIPAGALQEALSTSDEMKAIMGMYDASLGARSNETSGRAIMARQREGDVSTFHFIDNLTRAIRHAGRVLIDLIPHVYSTERIIRVLGPDAQPATVAVNTQQPVPVVGPDGQPQTDDNGQPLMFVYELGLGKYDLIVNAGPSFTSRREEAATQMTELIRAFPPAAGVLGDLVAKNMDWPEHEEVAKRLASLNPANQQQAGGIPPQVQEQIQQGMTQIAQLTAENQSMKADTSLKVMDLKIKEQEAQIKAFEAQTDRMKVENELRQSLGAAMPGQAQGSPN
jgi:hypothetical protein